MKLVNLTPHDINVENCNGEVVAIKPSGIVARLSAVLTQVRRGDYNFSYTIYGEVEFCEKGYQVPYILMSDANILYIVSMLVAQKVQQANVVSPDSGASAKRDINGQIEFVRGFITYV
jgi:hypothetical protein